MSRISYRLLPIASEPILPCTPIAPARGAFRLWDIHSVHFPFHSCPQHEFLGHNGYFKLVMSLSHHIEACALDKMGLDEKWLLETLGQDGIWLSEGLVPWQSITWRRRFLVSTMKCERNLRWSPERIGREGGLMR